PTGLAEANNPPSVKVTYSLTVVVVTDGIPFAQCIMQDQHVHIALGMLGAVLGVVVKVQRLATPGSSGQLARHFWRDIKHWLWRKTNGLLKRTQVYDHFFR